MRDDDHITLFLAGDVMTGRGIDQLLRWPGNPELHESYVSDAGDYVALAEQANGAIARPVSWDYVWGDALPALARAEPDLRIVNLETSITRSAAYWPFKQIHYRMNPANIDCLRIARLDACTLANNHVIDWGFAGLKDTLHTLSSAGIQSVGAGSNATAAAKPAVLTTKDGSRVLLYSWGLPSSGIPSDWAAGKDSPGVNYLSEATPRAVAEIAAAIAGSRQRGDIVVVSLHWGANWVQEIPTSHTEFARSLIDVAGVDLVHGHSSHHPLGIELYRSKLILYGCGDLINDYEGIGGYHSFRGDLRLLYLPRLRATTGELIALTLVPLQTQRLALRRATPADTDWLRGSLNRASRKFGTEIEAAPDGVLRMTPPRSAGNNSSSNSPRKST